MAKRIFWGQHKNIDLPHLDLVQVQRESFQDFLENGIKEILEEISPVSDFTEKNFSLSFGQYSFGKSKYTPEEAIEKGVTYDVPLKIQAEVVNKQTGAKNSQEVFLCDLPLMTETATFVINGAERVIVSQLRRSPGIIFEEDEEKNISSYGKKLYYARIIPYRGAWVEFEYDLNNALYVRIDKKRKLPATTFLRALGLESDSQILKIFYDVETVSADQANVEEVIGKICVEDVVVKESGEVLIEANKEITRDLFARLQEKKIKK